MKLMHVGMHACMYVQDSMMSLKDRSTLINAYLGSATLAVVFTAMFASVVFSQLILAEVFELVSHCLLQAHWK